MSKRLPTLLLPLLAALVLAVATPVSAHEQDAVRFATLPKPGPGFPEGIAADHAGRIYVSTFDFSPDKVNVIHVFARNGALAHTISLCPTPSAGESSRSTCRPGLLRSSSSKLIP